MHSSRMRTVRSSSYLLGGRGCLPECILGYTPWAWAWTWTPPEPRPGPGHPPAPPRSGPVTRRPWAWTHHPGQTLQGLGLDTPL